MGIVRDGRRCRWMIPERRALVTPGATDRRTFSLAFSTASRSPARAFNRRSRSASGVTTYQRYVAILGSAVQFQTYCPQLVATDRSAKMLWTFGRGEERVRIGRAADTCDLVVMTAPNQPRRYSFKDWSSLNAFQADIEARLLNTGWTLLQYSPERRRGRDRRGRPRIDDRRRWWTDSTEPRKTARTE